MRTVSISFPFIALATMQKPLLESGAASYEPWQRDSEVNCGTPAKHPKERTL